MNQAADIESLLSSLGYKLSDCGDHWRTSALYRGGDNPSSVQIYKSSGVWRDYVSDEGYKPLAFLIKKTVGEQEYKKYSSNFKDITSSTTQNAQELISMEKIFDESILEELLPHFSFYKERGIPEDILKFFKSGMSTEGQMYQRFVFPIFNKQGKIHGLAGRNMSKNSKRSKWKHVGKKSQWVYPLYCKSNDGKSPVLDAILSSSEVILVESIGDMLALHKFGIKNALVTFGLDVSPHLISILLGLSPKNIILSFNNDSSSEFNAGMIGSIKSYLKLLSYFDANKLHICLPLQNDFGEMDKDLIDRWINKKSHNISHHKTLINKLSIEADKYHKLGKISNNLYKNKKFLNE